MPKAQKRVDSIKSKPDIPDFTNDDYDSDCDRDQTERPDNITQVKSSSSMNIKLKLAGQLRKQRCAKLRTSVAVKQIPWKKLDGLVGTNEEELQVHLKEIIKQAGTVRTLDEVLADYQKNYLKYSIFSQPDHPKRPANAQMRYITENREKLTQELESKTGKSCSYVEVFKYGNEKFKKLSDKKKNVYFDKYKSDLEEYKQKKKELLENHPEFRKPKKVKSVKESSVHNSQSVRHPNKLLTPFLFYRQQEAKKGNMVAYAAAQSAWKVMSDKDKGKYVSELVNLQTDQQKKITKPEMKYLDRYNGLPKRAISAYNIFVQNFRAAYEGDLKDFMANLSIAWKSINEFEKQELQDQSDSLNENWKREMEAYIRKFPQDQQPMMFAKYNLFDRKNRKRSLQLEKNRISNLDHSPPCKKIKTKHEDASSSTEKSQKQISDMSELETVSDSIADSSNKSKIKQKLSSQTIKQEGSPGCTEKSQKQISDVSELETVSDSSAGSSNKSKTKKMLKKLPSQTTAHYYMTKIYEGKPEKIAKYYKKVSSSDKQIYKDRMRKQNADFKLLVDKYVKTLSQEQIAIFKLKTKKALKKQKKEIDWHVNTGTDNDEASDKHDSSDF